MTRTERQRRRRRNAWLARGAVTVAGAVALVALVLVLSTPSAAEADGEYIPPEATVPVVPIPGDTGAEGGPSRVSGKDHLRRGQGVLHHGAGGSGVVCAQPGG